MTKRETAHLLLKLMVIYAMLQFAPSLLYVIGLLGSINSSPRPQYALLMFGISLLAPLIWIGLCLLVLRFSGRLAARLMPEEGNVGTLFALSEPSPTSMVTSPMLRYTCQATALSWSSAMTHSQRPLEVIPSTSST